MKDADFLRSYRAVIRSYRLGPGPAARILNAVLRRIAAPPRSGQAPGAQDQRNRRNSL